MPYNVTCLHTLGVQKKDCKRSTGMVLFKKLNRNTVSLQNKESKKKKKNKKHTHKTGY